MCIALNRSLQLELGLMGAYNSGYVHSSCKTAKRTTFIYLYFSFRVKVWHIVDEFLLS